MEFKFDEAIFCRTVKVDDGGIRYYSNSTLTENQNIFSMDRLRRVFTQERRFEKSEERIIMIFDACGRLMQHLLSSIVIPNSGHKTSDTFVQMVLMKVLHKRRKFSFPYSLGAYARCKKEKW